MIFLDASAELTLKNSAYKKAVNRYVWEAYLEDLGRGDVTTKAFVTKPKQTVMAAVVAKEPGVLAGMLEAEWLIGKTNLSVIEQKKDGDIVKTGSVLMRLRGPVGEILAVERTLLNTLQRMSGIATATKRLRLKLPPGMMLLATRKTLWGLLDKRAVVVGGGATHRLNLGDAIMVKDNHWGLTENPEASLAAVFRQASKVRFVEFELQSLKEVDDFMARFQEFRLKYPLTDKVVVMLDNLTPDDIKTAAPLLDRAGIVVEVSGGINPENAHKFAIKGVSAMSSSYMMMRSTALDISLDILQ